MHGTVQVQSKVAEVDDDREEDVILEASTPDTAGHLFSSANGGAAGRFHPPCPLGYSQW